LGYQDSSWVLRLAGIGRRSMTSKWDHPDGWEPNYKKNPGQGKKPSIWRAAKAQQGIRAKTMKVTLPTIKSLEPK
jgi:hypothetical protein